MAYVSTGVRPRAWLSVLAGVAACLLLWGNWWLVGCSVIAMVGVFWSLGIVSNYALAEDLHWRESLREGMLAEGYTEEDVHERLKSVRPVYRPEHVPDWAVLADLLFSVACVGLLIAGLVLRLRR